MSDSITVDTARLPLLLQELRLPTVAKLWQAFTERADREGWPSARLLATLAELELAERARSSSAVYRLWLGNSAASGVREPSPSSVSPTTAGGHGTAGSSSNTRHRARA